MNSNFQNRFRRSRKEIDAALALTGGSFRASAKLLDMEPQEFRNKINHSKELKSKWGKPRGRQKGKLSFDIFDYDAQMDVGNWGPSLFVSLLSHATESDRQYIREWLNSH